MTREIKFRAWDGKKILPVENLDWVDGELRPFINETDWVNPDNLMQYTGLKDKNGKEIYEGDVVKITYDTPGENGLRNTIIVSVIVEWHTHGYTSIHTHGEIFINEGEVIGNIYENKNLINNK